MNDSNSNPNKTQKENEMKVTTALKATGRFIKNHKTAISCIAGAIVIAPFALAAAPVIAASLGAAGALGTTATTGTLISGLGGAALTNASLAAIGNGALVIGGAGMAGGTAVITGAGAAAGAATGLGAKAAVSRVSKRFSKNV